ncbi:Nucleolar protein [Apis cerana cerana]|uniref:Nucleolar protein n=1 Tax=Apis cerana cerana TaxID=94128 RepID=A0A2A3E2Q0_APICC|nr:Nucleolar protein [Apis cerana cerana]
MQPKLDINKMSSQPKKRRKINLVFDENKRREFLKGFRKRKLQRQQKAKEELQQQLKEERKRIKHEESIHTYTRTLQKQEYETEGHTVSILELNIDDLAEKNALIGENKGINTSEMDKEIENDKNHSENDEEIIGMSIKKKEQIKSSKENIKNKQIDNRKDFKKAIKKAALKQVKKSKAFQKKQKLERQKNKKESMRKRRRIEKAQKRIGKSKKKLNC